MAAEREEAVFMTKVAEQVERCDDMVEHMKSVAQMANEQELSVEERNLLSVAYKNVIGARRAAWRTINSLEAKEESKNNETLANRFKKYREKVCEGRDSRLGSGDCCLCGNGQGLVWGRCRKHQ